MRSSAVHLLLVTTLVLPLLAQVCEAANPPPPRGMVEESGEMHDKPDDPGFMRYAAWIPEKIPSGHKVALIVALHGLRQNEHTNLFYVGTVGLARNQLQAEAVVLGLKSKGEGWSDDDHIPIEKAIRWAEARWPIDTDRVYGYGISHGAMRMGIFAPRHQDVFAAVMMLSGNVEGLPSAPPGTEQDLSLYLMHGDADPIVPVQNGRDAARDLAAAGYRMLYREYTGEKHIYNGKLLEICLPDAIRWMFVQRLRHAPATPSATAALEAATREATSPAGKGSALVPLGELAGSQVDAVIASALASPSFKERLAATMLCNRRLYGRKVQAALYPMISDANADVRRAAIAALGLSANWRDSGAIDALVSVVQDPKAHDRALAAGELGVAWRLDRFCTNHNESIKKTLEGLAASPDPTMQAIGEKALAGYLVRDGLDIGIQIPPPGKGK